MSRSGWRRRLAGWLDPGGYREPGLPTVPEAAPVPRAVDVWPRICEQFALRVLAAAYQMSSQLAAIEAEEQDPDRLEKLYRIDHANTRIRRQAENLQVLAGRKVEDAGRQVTTLLDVVRAAASAIEHYPRVHMGRIADLAVVEFAADDVIRMLTELLDNATRYSPPSSTVLVSAHITELGSVLMRVEDNGIGLAPERLATINAMFDAEHPAEPDGEPGSHLGLLVVQRLALTHRVRVRLGGRQAGGTTGTVLVPEQLICEIPRPAETAHTAPRPVRPRPTRNGTRLPANAYRGQASVTDAQAVQPYQQPTGPINGTPPDGSVFGGTPPDGLTPVGFPPSGPPPSGPPPSGPPPSGPTPGGPASVDSAAPYADAEQPPTASLTARGLPRRPRVSLRGEAGPPAESAPWAESGPGAAGPPAGPGTGAEAPGTSGAAEPETGRLPWPDETADFAAGITDAINDAQHNTGDQSFEEMGR